MKKSYFSLLLILLFLVGFVFAQEETITFPIPELENCSSEEECRAYCDLPENMEACLDFAEANNLMSEKDIEMGRKMLELGKTEGPGGCVGVLECEAYCNNISNIKECIEFAEEHGLIPPDELKEAKKVIAAIDQGLTPPPCNGKAECDVYCSSPEHMEECLSFAEAAGLIPPDELEEAKKVIAAIDKGITPPPCKGKSECDVYCSAPEHMEECITFAEAAGFISPEEALMIKETGGRGPGGCMGKEECEVYCDEPDHMEECIEFAIKYGFISDEEAENAMKMLEAGLTEGPGGCQGQEECEAYCDDLAHMEECMNFAVKAGFITEEEAENAKKMAELGLTTGPGGCQSKEECEAYCENPDNMEGCMEFGEKMGLIEPGEREMMQEMMMAGSLGGCMTKEECEAYCDDPAHAQECIDFSLRHGYMTPEEAEKMLEALEMPPEGTPGAGPPSWEEGEEFYGPGGCKTEEECAGYCSQPEHFEECGMLPGEEMRPPPEEYMPPEEYEEYKEYREEGMMPPPEEEHMPPPEEEAPQTLFDLLNRLLGNAAAFLRLK